MNLGEFSPKYLNQSENKNDIPISSENFDPQNTELKKLQVFGAGPKMPGVKIEENVQKRACFYCNEGVQSIGLLHCVKCGNDFHKLCLFPPFIETSKGCF